MRKKAEWKFELILADGKTKRRTKTEIGLQRAIAEESAKGNLVAVIKNLETKEERKNEQ